MKAFDWRWNLPQATMYDRSTTVETMENLTAPAETLTYHWMKLVDLESTCTWRYVYKWRCSSLLCEEQVFSFYYSEMSSFSYLYLTSRMNNWDRSSQRRTSRVIKWHRYTKFRLDCHHLLSPFHNRLLYPTGSSVSFLIRMYLLIH